MAQSDILADTGNLASISFEEGITATLKVRRIVPPAEAIEKIDASILATENYRAYVPGDLADLPELEIEFLWDTFDAAILLKTNLGLVTITYPLRTGETTPASRTGSGYVSGITHPTLANGELQVGTLRIQYDNVDPLTYTKST